MRSNFVKVIKNMIHKRDLQMQIRGFLPIQNLNLDFLGKLGHPVTPVVIS